MMSEPVIVIFKDGNDVNVCGILFSSYPTGKIPEVGDKIPLYAERIFNISSGNNSAEPTPIKYLDELATVVEVWAGKGVLLHPKNGCPFYSFSDKLEGWGIRIAWDGEAIPKGVKPIIADVIFGL